MERPHFAGSAADLAAARAAVQLPVLRKDFTVDPRDVCDARLMGADCVLLIVAALDDSELVELLDLAARLELDALVEIVAVLYPTHRIEPQAFEKAVNQFDLLVRDRRIIILGIKYQSKHSCQNGVRFLLGAVQQMHLKIEPLALNGVLGLRMEMELVRVELRRLGTEERLRIVGREEVIVIQRIGGRGGDVLRGFGAWIDQHLDRALVNLPLDFGRI